MIIGRSQRTKKKDLIISIGDNEEYFHKVIQRFINSSMENPLDGPLRLAESWVGERLVLAEMVELMLRWLDRTLCWFWPQVRLPSDRSAISRSCRGLTSVWVNRWVLRFDLWLNIRWQMGQRWGDSSIWRILWTAKVRDWQKPFPHSLHLKGFSLEWMYRWSRRWSWRLKALPQISQLKGRSSVWVLSWIKRLYDFVNSRLQYLQMNRFFGLEALPGRWRSRGS